jgi:hypothetical protein
MLPPGIRAGRGAGAVHEGKLIFAQVMDHLPMHTFRRCVERYEGNKAVKSFSCSDQFLCMAFAQLTWRESLRDIETCLRAQSEKLYHMGIRLVHEQVNADDHLCLVEAVGVDGRFWPSGRRTWPTSWRAERRFPELERA